MAPLNPQYENALCYTMQDLRLMLGDEICAEGVADVSGGDLLVTTGGSGLNLSVAAGGVFIQGDDVVNQGMYHGYNDAAYTVTTGTADPTSPRIDQVVARVYDTQYGGTADKWQPEILAGTPTPGATLTNLSGATALSGDMVRLAYVLVPATFVGPFVNATHILDARKSFVRCGANPEVLLQATGATSLGNGAVTKIVLAETTRIDSRFFTVASSVVTIVQDGWYHINASAEIGLSASATFLRAFLDIAQTAPTGVSLARNEHPFNNAVRLSAAPTCLNRFLTAGTTIEFDGFQNSGGSVNTTHAASQISKLHIIKVG